MANWKYEGVAYKGDSASWVKDCFWAPEVYERNGKFYMLYSANWKNNPTNELENFRLGIAVANSPTGPFKEMYDKPIFDPGYPIIDGNIYFADDGKTYFYYSRCCYKHPVNSELATKLKKEGKANEVQESWIYGVEIKPDFSDVIGEPVVLLRPPATLADKQSSLEDLSALAGEGEDIRRWNEGSYLFKHGDTFYMMYSCNYWRGEHYAVGYATSKSPLGPFKKADNNPVTQGNNNKGGDVYCTGHNMVLTLANGDLYSVYHGRTAETDSLTGDKKRVAFLDKIEISANGELTVKGPTTTPQKIPVF
ncbi:MAG TPA: glycoside hydrolase family 43 protein [Pelobium sp.]